MQHGYPNGFDIGPFMQPVANSIFYPASSVDRSGLQQSNGQLPGLAGRGYAPQIPGGGPWHANGQGNIVVNRYAAPNTAPVTDQTVSPDPLPSSHC